MLSPLVVEGLVTTLRFSCALPAVYASAAVPLEPRSYHLIELD